jgi:hypothetical protein
MRSASCGIAGNHFKYPLGNEKSKIIQLLIFSKSFKRFTEEIIVFINIKSDFFFH